jgi:hypothetical protein
MLSGHTNDLGLVKIVYLKTKVNEKIELLAFRMYSDGHLERNH